ncbi:hypothetical protein [Psychromicrobium sp. YIM B11713]|uniref:hypothetical protein n=1 Tax=Psychromicrobium sp. YIM B11713 TaxID=3145233 RepID=UPI00374EBB6D
MNKLRKSGSRPWLRGTLAVGLVAASALTLMGASGAVAADGDEPGFTVEPVGTPLEPGFTVENYIHPNADQIAAQTNILLKEGNGSIIYAQCRSLNDGPKQIRVETNLRPNLPVCFDISAPTGWLKMEIPGSFGVRAATKDLTITTSEAGDAPEQQVIPANGRLGIDPSDSTEVTLLELRVK